MTEILIALVAALASGAGLSIGWFWGRLWGRTEGKSAGKEEARHEDLQDAQTRLERGRAALGAGRSAGDPAQRLRQNDGRW